MLRSLWLIHLFLNSFLIFLLALIQLVFHYDIGFWIPLILWFGIISGEHGFLKKYQNTALNREKWIFQAFCTFASLGILSSLGYFLKPLERSNLRIQYASLEVSQSSLQSSAWFLDPDFLVYWEETTLKPFQEISEKKPLESLMLPPPPFPPLTFLNLLVVPYPQFSKLPRVSKNTLFEQFILTDEEREKEAEEAAQENTTIEPETPLKPLEENPLLVDEEAKKIKELKKLGVRPYDMILLKNNTQIEGKILNQLEGDILIEIKTGKAKDSRYTAKKEEIQQVVPALSLTTVYRQKIQETTNQDTHFKIAQDLIQYAETYQDPECLTLAQEIFRQLLKNRPQPELYLALDQIYQKNALLEDRLAFYEEARVQGTLFPELLCREAEILLTLGANELAEQRLQEARKLDPVFERAPKMLIQFYLESHQFDSALNLLEKLGSSSKSYPLLWAHYLYATGQFAQAEKALYKLLPEQQVQPEITFLIGNCLYYQGKYTEAIACYEQIQNKIAVSVSENLATSYLRLKKHAKAKQFYSIFAQEHPENPAPGYTGLGMVEMGTKKLESAEKFLADALNADPTSLLASYYNAVLWYSKGEIEQAEEQLKSLLNNHFYFKEPCLLLAQIQGEQQQYDTATIYLEEYLSASPEDADRSAHLAYLYLLQNQEEKARILLEEVLNTNPSHLYSLRGLAYLENLKKNQRESIRRFEEILAKQPDDEYAKLHYLRIKNNVSYVRWDDNFSRKDSLEIARQWIEEENVGIQIQVKNQQLLFEGTQTEGNQYTFAERSTEAEQFISFRADLTLKSGQSMVGIHLRPGKNSRGVLKNFYFGRDKNGQLVYSRYERGQQTFQWETIGTWPSSGEFHQLKIERKDELQGTFTIWLDDRLLPAEIVLPEFKAGPLKVGIFGSASTNASWNLQIDNVQIVEKKK
ncbi:MAG: tetratricopeptide repeat protein [Planctomycetota bacterium]